MVNVYTGVMYLWFCLLLSLVDICKGVMYLLLSLLFWVVEMQGCVFVVVSVVPVWCRYLRVYVVVNVVFVVEPVLVLIEDNEEGAK